MLLDITKIIISFILTGIVGVFITARVQRTNFINQTKISKSEKDLEKTKEIIKKIESLSSIRSYTAKVVVGNLVDGSPEIETDKSREDYRKAVFEWNANMQSIFIELRGIDLNYFGIRLENEVQFNFKKSHDLIRAKISNNSHVTSDEIISTLHTVYKETRKISYDMLNTANEKWKKTLDGNHTNLDEYNIDTATSWTLIKALFHKNPRKLRVISPERD